MNYLHVGYPKCGSSFLQNAYFTQENGFCNLLIHAPHEFRDFIAHDLLISDSMSYSGKMPAITEHSVFKKNIGLSAEDFITAPVDYSLLLDRWTELFPTSKVLIVIRSQPDLIYSWYVQLINAGYFRNIHQFTRELMWDRQRSIWGRLDYDSVARLTIEKFTDVKIVIYETMNTDYSGYIRDLNSFFETNAVVPNQKYRKTPSYTAVLAMRTLNSLFRHGYGLSMMSIQPSYNVGPGRGRVNNVILPVEGNRRANIHKWSKRIAKIMPKFDRKINNRQIYRDEYEDLFVECFGESNRRLRDLTGLDLGKYNYPGV